MGMDFHYKNGRPTLRYGFGYAMWSWLLRLALEYGWKPLGLKPPLTDDSRGPWTFERVYQEYGASCNALLTSEDATGLAAALERMLADPRLLHLHVDDERGRAAAQEIGSDVYNCYVSCVNTFDSRADFQACIEEFIAFCRTIRGGFRLC